jgi:acyl-CoA reductase-like NAD-dependent aldehyde dehydrogenase
MSQIMLPFQLKIQQMVLYKTHIIKNFIKNKFLTGNELAKLVQCDETIVETAVKSARDALEDWKKLGFKGRGRIIYK